MIRHSFFSGISGRNGCNERTQQEQMILFLRLVKPPLFAVYADFADTPKLRNSNVDRLFMVPVERIELATFGYKTDGPLLHSPPSPAEMPRNKMRRLR
jgi:hypothetical protein